MKPHRAERDVLAGLLSREWDDVDDLVDAVFDAVAGQVLARPWRVLVGATDSWLMVAGPFATERQALARGPLLEVRDPSVKWWVRRLVTVVADMDDDGVSVVGNMPQPA